MRSFGLGPRVPSTTVETQKECGVDTGVGRRIGTGSWRDST